LRHLGPLGLYRTYVLYYYVVFLTGQILDMITLDDKVWKELRGGYKMPYDVSVPLRRLERSTEKKEIDKIYDELWNELHHQGDVELASYLAIPQLVSIARQKGLFDWNVLALCATIEQQRQLGKNPQLPTQYLDYYQKGWTDLKEFIIDNLNSVDDEITLRAAMSAFAACNGQVKLSKAIIEMSDDVLDEFLEQF
jgi:hypothetical protein